MASPSFAIEAELSRPPLCATAPLLWSVIAVAIMYWIIITMPAWLAALFALAVAVVIYACRRACSRLLLAAPVVSILLLVALHQIRIVEQPSGWQEQPPREATLLLRVEENFMARREGYSAGIGKIIDANDPRNELAGHRVAFYLRHDMEPKRKLIRGEVIRATASIRFLAQVDEPNSFQQYLGKRKIGLQAGSGNIESLVTLAPLQEAVRQRLLARFSALLAYGAADSGHPGNVLASMLLGNRELLTADRQELYKRTGTLHLFAVSGLHVGAVALCLGGLLTLIGMGRNRAAILILLGVWGYVWVTGSSPSACRAGCMISVLIIARCLWRQSHLFPALVLSAWLVLIIDPGQLFQLGFQLSYAVVGAIVLIGIPASISIEKWLRRREQERPPARPVLRQLLRLRLNLLQLFAISLSAAMGSMPLIIEHFSLFTPAGVMAGVMLNWLVMILVMLGCLIMLTGLLPVGMLPGLLAVPGWPVLSGIEWSLAALLAMPGAVSERQWLWPNLGYGVLIFLLSTAWLLQWLRQNGRAHYPALHAIPVTILLIAVHALTVEP